MVGFKIQNKDSILSKFICPQCSRLLRNPVQLTSCGHRICQSCTEEQEGDMIVCVECREKMSREKVQFDRGFSNEMQMLLIVCGFCNWTDILKNYQSHLNETHPNSTCIYCEEKFLSVYDLDQHEVYQCQKVTIDCPLKQFGCKEMILRVNLKQHYRSLEHQLVFINIIQYLKSIERSTLENNAIQLQEILETLDILSNSLTISHDDLERLWSESNQYEVTCDQFRQDFSAINTSIQEQYGIIDSVKVNQNILEQDLNSIEQDMNDIIHASYDGTFMWKITDVQSKINDAQLEEQTSIDSPSFYSSSTGYKMCLRVYLNGDRNGRGKFISLFFILMRGEYDAILKFPFDFKITFCLYDQTDKKNHIIDTFRPDINSNSFERPRSDMNIASGISSFASLTLFQQQNNPYVRDDTIFIKVLVDFNDTPKDLLPYTFNLNAGLTSQIQSAKIRQEVEKRQSSSASTTMKIVTD